MLDVRNFTCTMMEEACAFRAQVSADRRRAMKLVEAFRRAVAAVRLQASSRRLLAVRRFGRARNAQQVAAGSNDSSDAVGWATKRAARRWLGFALRAIRCASDPARAAEGQRRKEEQRARGADRQRAWEQARTLRWERREVAAVRLQAAGRMVLAWRRLQELREERDWAERYGAFVHKSDAEEEPAWLREAEGWLAAGITQRRAKVTEVSPPRSEEVTRRATRVGDCSPKRLFSSRLPPPTSIPLQSPTAAAPAAERRDGEARRCGGRQRRLYRDLKAERRADAAAARAAHAGWMAEWVAYDESIRSEMERQERQLHREREESRQLAMAMVQSAGLGGLDAEGQAAFVLLCDEAGIAPSDVQIPVRTPRVGDNATELRFSRKCRARRISIDGRRERWKEKMDAIGSARSLAEVVMAERFGIEVRHAKHEPNEEAYEEA